MPNLNVGLGAAMPAFAESFPSNGLMLENKTYSGAATVENMLVYGGTAYASAEYVDTLQQIIGGTYLPAGAMVAEQCPANSYCPGMTDATVNSSESQGISSCPSDYPNSAVGASAITQCYTACKDSMVEHASAVSGNDYYGDGTDTCFATDCENGYHVYETVKVIEQSPLIDVDLTVEGDNQGHNSDVGDDMYADEYGLTEIKTWAAEFDYGVVYGRVSCQATSPKMDINSAFNIVNAVMDGEVSLDQVRSDLTPIVGAVKANYLADLVAGAVDGTIESEEEFIVRFMPVFGLFEDASFSTSDTGQYCYCQMTGFQSAQSGESGYDISTAVAIESAPWVFNQGYNSENMCAKECEYSCARAVMTGNSSFRGAVFGAFGVTDVSTCDANEITIKWTDATDEDIAANNAGMCTYGGDIRTPIRAATIPGKTFVGWKFTWVE